jgi:hypothetical protein
MGRADMGTAIDFTTAGPTFGRAKSMRDAPDRGFRMT